MRSISDNTTSIVSIRTAHIRLLTFHVLNREGKLVICPQLRSLEQADGFDRMRGPISQKKYCQMKLRKLFGSLCSNRVAVAEAPRLKRQRRR